MYTYVYMYIYIYIYIIEYRRGLDPNSVGNDTVRSNHSRGAQNTSEEYRRGAQTREEYRRGSD